uniref:Uncharacterized protein n=2 Tax=Candidatus Methanogaster sp. ANME-2c ERB4 TaxID=2759911 RepID=A0A7G9Y7A6_9EURY|nr:hypothetical protein HNHCPBFK_00020 [Methanosarcinales archaeon ANME-2c ERB4]
MNFTQALPVISNVLISGDNVIEWAIIKVVMAILGGFALYFILFVFHDPPPIPKVKTKPQIFAFIIISALGGLAILRPEDALAAFPAGLIGWYLVLKHIEGHEQESKRVTREMSVVEGVGTQDKIKGMYKK